MSRLFAQLTPVQPYDFELLLSVLRRYPEQSVFQIETGEDAAYYRVLRCNDAYSNYVLVRVTPGCTTSLENIRCVRLQTSSCRRG